MVLLLLPSVCFAEGASYNPDVPPPYPPAHEPSGDDYFTDAVFIGDSLMTDVEMLDLFPTANFVCLVGMSPLSAIRKQFRYKGSEELLNVYEATARYPHNKIFILLGSNSLDNKNSEESLADYLPMIEEFIRWFPESYIFVISPSPGTYEKMAEKYISTNRFKNFSAGLLKIAQEKNLYYLDFYPLLLDETGYLASHYDCGDGQHPSNGGYEKLEELIRTHTVEYQGSSEE